MIAERSSPEGHSRGATTPPTERQDSTPKDKVQRLVDGAQSGGLSWIIINMSNPNPNLQTSVPAYGWEVDHTSYCVWIILNSGEFYTDILKKR